MLCIVLPLLGLPVVIDMVMVMVMQPGRGGNGGAGGVGDGIPIWIHGRHGPSFMPTAPPEERTSRTSGHVGAVPSSFQGPAAGQVLCWGQMEV